MMQLDGLAKLTESIGKILLIVGRVEVLGFNGSYPGERKSLIEQFEDAASDLIGSLAYILENQRIDINRVIELTEEKLQVFRDEDEETR